MDDDDFVAAVEEWPQGDVYPSTSTIKDEIEEAHEVEYDRKTVYRRLDSLESEGKINKFEVGRGRGKSVGWYVGPAEPADTGAPASGGMQTQPRDAPADYDGPEEPEPTNNTAGLLSRLSGDRGNMSIPAAMLVILLAFIGWKTYKSARNRVTGGRPVIDTSEMTVSIPGAIYMGVLGSGIVVIVTFGTWLALSLYTSATAGNALLALSYATGIAGLVATLAHAGGAIGAPARLLSWFFGGETA
ncbi:PRA1 family protein [Halorientalis marina]|uniref:PRA1 family protein n=1 Tax=Halorientalis marina TaxID=2931976 RepID=UPI001FF55A56|nr:PRA1 family protein [Halorientalis marina]